MTDGPTNPPPGGTKSLFERAKDIIVSPKSEWSVIDGEQSSVAGIVTGYVLILAAIGPIATFIGQQVFGMSLLGVTFKPPMTFTVATVVIGYVMAIVGCYVTAFIIDALAPSFGGTKNFTNAFKVAAYSATAAWLAQIFGIVPMLGILSIVGLYSLYLLYLGLPRLMRVGEDKAVGYTVVVIVVWIVIYALIVYLTAALVLSFVGPMYTAPMPVIRY